MEKWYEQDNSNQLEAFDQYLDESYGYDPRGGRVTIHAWETGNTSETPDKTEVVDFEEHDLSDYVGTDLAKQYDQGKSDFTGEDLVMGEHAKSAQGAMFFYDQKLFGFVNKYLKKFGVKARREEITSEHPILNIGWNGSVWTLRRGGAQGNSQSSFDTLWE